MQRHTASSGRETAPYDMRSKRGDCSPASPSNAAASAMPTAASAILTAIPPQQAWVKQLVRAGAADIRPSHAASNGRKKESDGSSIATAPATAPEMLRSASSKSIDSAVDRILKSSVKQHSYTYASSRIQPSLEVARSPYAPPGSPDAVQIRRDVKDSVHSEEYAPASFCIARVMY